MPRCCQGLPDEFAPCYASVLVAGPDLQAAVERVEAQPLAPCVTTWCTRCCRVSLLTGDAGLFPTPAAHHAHMLALHARLPGLLRPLR